MIEQEGFIVLVKTIPRDWVAVRRLWAAIKGLEELLGALLQMIDAREGHGRVAGGMGGCCVGSLGGVD